jgi:hypothetical protein
MSTWSSMATHSAASIDSSEDDHGLHPAPEGQRATVTLWTDDTAPAYRTLTAAGVPGFAEPRPFSPARPAARRLPADGLTWISAEASACETAAD